MVAQQIRYGGRNAFVRNMRDDDAGIRVEELEEEMIPGAAAG